MWGSDFVAFEVSSERVETQLQQVYELSDVRSIYQSVMYVDRYGQSFAVFVVGDFAEGDARCRVFCPVVACMGQRCEVQPRQRGEADEILCRRTLQVVAVPALLYGERAHANEFMQVVVIRIVGKTDGAVWAANRATGVNSFVLPWFTVQNACPEVLNVLRCREGTMHLCEEDGEVLGLGIGEGFRAVHPDADTVEWLAEVVKEVEQGRAGPGREVYLAASFHDG